MTTLTALFSRPETLTERIERVHAASIADAEKNHEALMLKYYPSAADKALVAEVEAAARIAQLNAQRKARRAA
jgi:hypothetical protein